MLSFENARELVNNDSSLVYNVLDYYSEYDIYEIALGFKPVLKKAYLSVFTEEKSPSMNFYIKNNKLMFKCFSSGYNGDCFEFLQRFYNISFKETIEVINKRKCFTGIMKRQIVEHIEYKNKIEVSLFEKIPESFINYWKSFHVSEKTLKYLNIKPVRYVFINTLLFDTYNNSNIIIRYITNGRYKIYKPFEEKTKKWKSNNLKDDIFALHLIKSDGPLLIITKAMKDIAVLIEMGFVNSIAPSSESVIINEEIINNLKSRFSKIIVIFDNDKKGIEMMQKYKEIYGFDFVIIDDKKDISDYAKEYGLSKTKEMLEEKIKKL